MPNEEKLPPSLSDIMDDAEAKEGEVIKNKSSNEEEDDKIKEEALEKEKKEEKEVQDKLELEKVEKEKLLKEENNKKEGKLKEEKEEEDEVTKAKGFWKDVEKITGEEVEVEFGDIMPDTPEGAAKFVQAFRDKGIEQFENDLKIRFPREYRALELAIEGLDPSTLYKEQTTIDYSKITVDEKDLIGAKNIYAQSLKLKGNNDEDIADLIKVAEDKGKILEKGKIGLKELQDYQSSKEQQLDEETSKQIQDKTEKVNKFVTFVDSLVNKGEVGDFIIPEKDRKPLVDQLVNNTRIIDGKFYLMEELTEKDLVSKLQAEYFKLKKGNLNDLVKRKAATEQVKKLKTRVEEGNAKPKGESSGKFTSLSLQDLEEN